LYESFFCLFHFLIYFFAILSFVFLCFHNFRRREQPSGGTYPSRDQCD
jgi:hypothetical protein